MKKKSDDPGGRYEGIWLSAIQQRRLDLLDLVLMLCSECRSASAPGVARIVLKEIYDLGVPLRANMKSPADIRLKQAMEEMPFFGGNHGDDYPSLKMLAYGLEVDPNAVCADLLLLACELLNWIKRKPPHRLSPAARSIRESEKKEIARKEYSRCIDQIKKLTHDLKCKNRKLKDMHKSLKKNSIPPLTKNNRW